MISKWHHHLSALIRKQKQSVPPLKRSKNRLVSMRQRYIWKTWLSFKWEQKLRRSEAARNALRQDQTRASMKEGDWWRLRGRSLSFELKPSTCTLAANQKEILCSHCCQFQFIRGKRHWLISVTAHKRPTSWACDPTQLEREVRWRHTGSGWTGQNQIWVGSLTATWTRVIVPKQRDD